MVFKTIAENVQSFFQKEEDLEQEPKKVPDAAIELYEKPIAKEHGIVAHHLPKQAPEQRHEPIPAVRPKLPFSSEQLKEQLTQSVSEPTGQLSSVQPEPEITSEEDISSAIAEFEEAINEVPGEDGSTAPISETVQQSLQRGEGYFDQLAERLREQGYDQLALQGALDAMKAHHEQRAAVAEQRSQNEALEQELTRKLTELQSLEHEWATKRDNVSAAQNRMAELEGAIVAKTGDLKEIVASRQEVASDVVAPITQEFTPEPALQQRAHLVPQPVYPVKKKTLAPFILMDGTELTSLPKLCEALLNMSDATFYHHVTPERNDFSTWIRDSLGDEVLAARVMHSPSKYEMAKLLH
ncbi:hypothetical protein GOV07_02525 [Candidatus Woesearchaeota archaeon]|nr:hypothetical protein [Candidatus Woesearchaeota archaeon]